MKQLVFACILICGAYQLKAQRLQVKPVDSLAIAIDRSVKSQIDPWNLLKSNLKGNETIALNSNNLNYANFSKEYFQSNMPVAVLKGDSKMPVAQLDGYDNMPVKRINPADPEILLQKMLPGAPSFKSPAILSPAPKK